MIFFGNEFFDAMPIKQFKKVKNTFFEKNYSLDKNYKIKETFEKAYPTTLRKLDPINLYKN